MTDPHTYLVLAANSVAARDIVNKLRHQGRRVRYVFGLRDMYGHDPQRTALVLGHGYQQRSDWHELHSHMRLLINLGATIADPHR
ncbi:hypothetical protein [Nonomuraea typhae]|uniref:hypothetical protein n=1 Tax=Nonomuraea typhae TaxID=2603600 RepID=UPI0012FCBCB6|nr:hypothetical protein [Nonomuraea typhae]